MSRFHPIMLAVACFTCFPLTPSQVAAQDPTSVVETQTAETQTAETQTAAESGVREVLGRYVKAFNDRDFATLTDLVFSEMQYRDETSGTQVDDAATFVERIRNATTAEPSLSLQAAIQDFQQQDASTVLIRGSTTLTADDVADEVSSFAVTMKKTDGAWKIDAIVEQSPQATLNASAGEAIESLGWLLGTWADSSSSQLTSTFEYLPGNKFLRRSITASETGELLGLELIGYDAKFNRVRSWIYFTDGSFGSGYWTGYDDHWSLSMTQTLADGRTASGTYVIRPTDSDTMVVKLIGREVDGQPVPSGKESVMTRVTSTSESSTGELEKVGEEQ